MLGFGGAIVLGSTGLGAGGAGAVAGWHLSRAPARDEPGISLGGRAPLGTAGSVVPPIPAGGYGEVLVYLAGQPMKYAAKSAGPVERGTEVWV